MLSGKPCKVTEMSTSKVLKILKFIKAGKHGAAKASIAGVDIFTGKKVEDSAPSTANIDCPVVKKIDY